LNKKPKKNLKWNDHYNELVDYKNEHGHAPKRECQLGTWCHTQCTLFQNKMNKVSKNGLIYLSVQTTTGQAYAATRQLAGHTGLAGLARHASLTENAYFAGHANFVNFGDLARLCTSRT
jgi:hypothetical protein